MEYIFSPFQLLTCRNLPLHLAQLCKQEFCVESLSNEISNVSLIFLISYLGCSLVHPKNNIAVLIILRGGIELKESIFSNL